MFFASRAGPDQLRTHPANADQENVLSGCQLRRTLPKADMAKATGHFPIRRKPPPSRSRTRLCVSRRSASSPACSAGPSGIWLRQTSRPPSRPGGCAKRSRMRAIECTRRNGSSSASCSACLPMTPGCSRGLLGRFPCAMKGMRAPSVRQVRQASRQPAAPGRAEQWIITISTDAPIFTKNMCP